MRPPGLRRVGFNLKENLLGGGRFPIWVCPRCLVAGAFCGNNISLTQPKYALAHVELGSLLVTLWVRPPGLRRVGFNLKENLLGGGRSQFGRAQEPR